MRQYSFTVFHKTDDLTLLRCFDQDKKPVGERKLDADEIEGFAKQVEADYRKTSPNLVGLGRQLYQWLDGPTERWLESAIKDGGPGLAIHIGVEGQLRHLPWELMHSASGFLCAKQHHPFTPVRRVTAGGGNGQGSAANRPLRVLFMASSAEDARPVLDYEAEERMILAATRGSHREIELIVEESGSLAGLKEVAVTQGPGYFDVFHLTGHADVRGETPIFVMENDTGFRHDVTADQIASAFEGNWPRLVFLSGCKTGQAAEHGKLPSLCEALVSAGAPAVLGWALPVGDTAASAAAAALYEHLAVGKRVDEAVARARQKMIEKEIPDWHLLRLYADSRPLSQHVTPPATPKRDKLHIRAAESEAIDAGAKIEVCKREFFVGRRRPIQRCLRVLRSVQGDADYAEGVLLHGMGGLGKSSLAVRLCERMTNRKRLIMVGRIDEVELQRTLSDKLPDPDVIKILNAPELNLKQRLCLLLHGPLEQVPSLFFFDDFEHNLDITDGKAALKPEALAILQALMFAIRETKSDSRVIVTSCYTFPLTGPAGLRHEGLESARDADLDKKCELLPALRRLGRSGEEKDRELRHRIVGISAGNFRLLERLNQVLGDKATNHDSLLAAMEGQAAQFREEILLKRLLAQQTAECQRLLALLSVCHLPVDREAVAAIVGTDSVDPHLARAVAVGLIESGIDQESGEPQYYVSGILDPLLEGEVTDSDRMEACRRAAQHLHARWWVATEGRRIGRALEIHRLALLGRAVKVAIEVANGVATLWTGADRFREVAAICEATLKLAEDFRILHSLARAEKVLGRPAARKHYEQALSLCPIGPGRERATLLANLAVLLLRQGVMERALQLLQQSLQINEQIGDLQGKAAVLSNMAQVMIQQGNLNRAGELLQESLDMSKQIGDRRSEADTLTRMARVIAKQGRIDRAMDLWQRSLDTLDEMGEARIKASTLGNMAEVFVTRGEIDRAIDLSQQALGIFEQIGDAYGKAATLNNMARVMAQHGDVPRAIELWNQSLALCEQMGDVRGRAAVLINMVSATGYPVDVNRARDLHLEAARDLASVRAWPDLAIVLGSLGILEGTDSTCFVAQALWLTLRVGVPVEDAFSVAGALLLKIGPDAEYGPLVACAALFMVQTRGQYHLQREEMLVSASGMLGACAEARKIEPEKFEEWFESQRLNDPSYFMPALDKALEGMVGEEGWLFDRALVAGSARG